MALLFGGLAGGAGFLLASRLASADAVKVLRPLELLVALPILLWLVLLTHELGHVAAAWLRGWRFLMLLVGPLRLVQGRSGLDWAFNRAWPTWGGLAASVPREEAGFRRDMTVVVLGGPLASLLLAAMAIAASRGTGRLAAYAFLVGLPSLLIGIITLVPMRTGGFASDGMQAWQLLRGGDGPLRRARRVRLMTHGLSGGRPRDLAPDDIARAIDESDTPTDAVALWNVALYAALDRGDHDAALAAAEQVATQYQAFPDGMRQMLTIDLAYLSARYRRDADTARRWLALSAGGFVEPYQRPLAAAALAWLETRPADARTAIAEARRALSRAMDPGAAQMVSDQLDALERDLPPA